MLALALLWMQAVQAAAVSASAADPDDVALALDLKTVAHEDDGQSISYTLETYEPFPDEATNFEWRIDKSGDRVPDLFVTAEWGESGEGLIGIVEDAAENQLAEATVSKTAPNAIRVSFPTTVLGTVPSYDYNVLAHTDVNANGEVDRGEQDLAPDTGLYRHRLGTEAQAPTAAPAPSPQQAAPGPPTSTSPAQDPQTAPQPRPARAVAAENPAGAPQPAGAVGASPAARPGSPTGQVQESGSSAPVGVGGASASVAPGAGGGEAPGTIARTGAAHLGLVMVAGASILSGFPIALLARRRRGLS